MVPMLMLSLVGVYGNSVVIYTLTNLHKKTHHMLVMLSLAFSDFISCCETFLSTFFVRKVFLFSCDCHLGGKFNVFYHRRIHIFHTAIGFLLYLKTDLIKRSKYVNSNVTYDIQQVF